MDDYLFAHECLVNHTEMDKTVGQTSDRQLRRELVLSLAISRLSNDHRKWCSSSSIILLDSTHNDRDTQRKRPIVPPVSGTIRVETFN